MDPVMEPAMDPAMERLLAEAFAPDETMTPADLSARILEATQPAIQARRRPTLALARPGMPTSARGWAGLAMAAAVLLAVGLTLQMPRESAPVPAHAPAPAPAPSAGEPGARQLTATWPDQLDEQLARIGEQVDRPAPGSETIDAELALLAWDIENVDDSESYAAVTSAVNEWTEQWELVDGDENWGLF